MAVASGPCCCSTREGKRPREIQRVCEGLQANILLLRGLSMGANSNTRAGGGLGAESLCRDYIGVALSRKLAFDTSPSSSATNRKIASISPRTSLCRSTPSWECRRCVGFDPAISRRFTESGIFGDVDTSPSARARFFQVEQTRQKRFIEG